MGKHNQEEAKQDTNAWMTTYTDLMTLLLTFFVLLISISNIDTNRKREALDSLIGAFGFKPGGQSVLGKEKGMNITLASAPMVKEKIDFSELQNIAFKNGLGGQVKVRREKEKIIVTLSNRVLFRRGSTRLKPESRKFLVEVAHVLRRVPGLIELRGFCDQTETILEPNPMQRSMFLSTERAMAVYLLFHKEAAIPTKKMVAHGFGQDQSKTNTAEGLKTQYRQVEIICNYRSRIPFHLTHGPPRRNILLDFKGFLFKLRGEKGG